MAWYMKLHKEAEEDFRDVGLWGVYKPPKESLKEKSIERFILADLLSIPIASLCATASANPSLLPTTSPRTTVPP
jgi:hypothetical protein